MEKEFVENQDVVVQSENILDGEAFFATISDEETMSDGTVYVELGDNFDAELALVSVDDVLTLTELFTAVKQSVTKQQLQNITKSAISKNKTFK